jgi:hypothetical protein
MEQELTRSRKSKLPLMGLSHVPLHDSSASNSPPCVPTLGAAIKKREDWVSRDSHWHLLLTLAFALRLDRRGQPEFPDRRSPVLRQGRSPVPIRDPNLLHHHFARLDRLRRHHGLLCLAQDLHQKAVSIVPDVSYGKSHSPLTWRFGAEAFVFALGVRSSSSEDAILSASMTGRRWSGPETMWHQ